MTHNQDNDPTVAAAPTHFSSSRLAQDQTDQGPRVTAALAQLWEHSKDRTLGRVGVLAQAATAWQAGTLDEEFRRNAEREAHKLTGSLGTFGFPHGSLLARDIELLLRGAHVVDPPQSLRLAELVTRLRQELIRPLLEPLLEPQIAPLPRQDAPFLLVVDEDRELAMHIVQTATTHGLRAQSVPTPSAARAAVAEQRPDIVLLALSLSNGAEASLTLLEELTSLTPPIPVMVMTTAETLVDRVAVARRGGRVFLQKPLSPAQILEVVMPILAYLQADQTTIMIVDDDTQMLAVLQVLLEPHGFQIVTLADPRRFWDMLEEVRPDLLILDVDMPHLNGIELCRVVRNHPHTSGLPILFLTALTDAQTMQLVFAAGADDFVSKPIVGPELLTRVTNRLERSRLLRNLAERDPLTGIANRRKFTEVFDRLLHLARRYQQSLGLAVLDLDHFKQINDRYGHAAGDAVLCRLSSLLVREFRATDVVARWGGEEFVLGLYGLSCHHGVRRLTEFLEALRHEEFTGADGTRFQVTFSAGVAAYPANGADLQTLYRAADHTLYQAKATGRARVLSAGG